MRRLRAPSVSNRLHGTFEARDGRFEARARCKKEHLRTSISVKVHFFYRAVHFFLVFRVVRFFYFLEGSIFSIFHFGATIL